LKAPKIKTTPSGQSTNSESKASSSSQKRKVTPLRPAQKATLDAWYDETCVKVDTGNYVEDRIKATKPWESYQQYCEAKKMNLRMVGHAKKNQQKDYLIAKGHTHVNEGSNQRWFYNLKLN